MNKPTGLELIAQERHEQIHKHGYSLELDADFYRSGELVQAALFCLAPEKNHWPNTWDKESADKIMNKSKIGRWKVAGAFYVAEDERLGEEIHKVEVSAIAKLIDNELTHDPNSPLN